MLIKLVQEVLEGSSINTKCDSKVLSTHNPCSKEHSIWPLGIIPIKIIAWTNDLIYKPQKIYAQTWLQEWIVHNLYSNEEIEGSLYTMHFTGEDILWKI